MYSVYRSKHALSAEKNREFGGAAVEHQGGRKTVNYRGPNSRPRFLWIAAGAPHCETSPVELPRRCPLVVRLMFHAPVSRYIRRQQAIDQHH